MGKGFFAGLDLPVLRGMVILFFLMGAIRFRRVCRSEGRVPRILAGLVKKPGKPKCQRTVRTRSVNNALRVPPRRLMGDPERRHQAGSNAGMTG